MGKKLVTYSDISNTEIKDGDKTAVIVVEFSDKRRGTMIIDALQEEAENIASKGRKATREELIEHGFTAIAERAPSKEG